MIRNRKDLAKVKRIVVKVGTSTITYPNCSRNFTRMDHRITCAGNWRICTTRGWK